MTPQPGAFGKFPRGRSSENLRDAEASPRRTLRRFGPRRALLRAPRGIFSRVVFNLQSDAPPVHA